ncbi:MAG: acyl-CoA carboxylase epsilon subunit [Microbacterium sp.]|uniref:acyl-CoA carboxylase epsilon subunit n=1 Tax=Microbacterium sp. TaxID=51671 RepID=UPI00263599EE|nr:acyl-CoA carboxylase epsilon subunit [Microbacterium sp.]MCX6501973.1 acyl-CoA carboxylase epsilon subunit [Microbacterium sp.]
MSTDEAPLRIDVPRGNPTAEELAAVVAVVGAAYAQERSAAVVDDDQRSSWHVSQRSLRQPLRRELGWGRFG